MCGLKRERLVRITVKSIVRSSFLFLLFHYTHCMITRQKSFLDSSTNCKMVSLFSKLQFSTLGCNE